MLGNSLAHTHAAPGGEDEAVLNHTLKGKRHEKTTSHLCTVVAAGCGVRDG